jgi:16S rRNA (guanine(966)-N(2))-methyltransferase RsmD
MRISAGVAKGRRTATKKLLSEASKREHLRPTSSKVREALFDILRDSIREAVFVDLYAGTGTVGLEALSRGAKKAVFVEQNSLRARTIHEIVRELGFEGQAEVIRGKAYDFIVQHAAEQADICFVDPPYKSSEIDTILPHIGETGFLRKQGIVIVEHFFKRKVPEKAGNVIMSRSYRYGDTMLTVYRKVA